MSLYISIVLLSALSAFDDDHPPEKGDALLLVLGTTVGLVLAHGFAAWVSARIMDDVSEEVGSGVLLRAQLGGALAVASLVTVAILVVPTAYELVAARFTVAATIAGLVFSESRNTKSAARAALLGLLALAVAATVAAVESFLVH